VAKSNDVYGARIACTVTATVMISAACLAGYADGCLQNDRDARNFFYLTNPEGTAGDYLAHLRLTHGCAPGTSSASRADCRTMVGQDIAR
jgi:hypothetical protein